MKRSMKFLAASLAVATSVGVLGSAAMATPDPMTRAKQELKTNKVSDHEVKIQLNQKKLDVKEVTKGNYIVSEEVGSQTTNEMKLTVIPSVKNNVKGYDVTIVDLKTNQTVLHSFSDKDVFKLEGSQLSKNTTGPNAIVYAIVTGNYWGLGAAATAILGKMESLGWFQVVSELFAEGESIWAIAGLLVSALPELGIAIGFGTAF